MSLNPNVFVGQMCYVHEYSKGIIFFLNYLMQILRQALEEFELTRDVNVDTCASPPEAETITAEAPTQDEEPFFQPPTHQ